MVADGIRVANRTRSVNAFPDQIRKTLQLSLSGIESAAAHDSEETSKGFITALNLRPVGIAQFARHCVLNIGKLDLARHFRIAER